MNFRICLCLTALSSFGCASYAATPGEAPRAVACNEGETGALNEASDKWVLAKSDTQDDGSDHYQVLALSAWASAGNSTYCLRWELENRSPKVPPTAAGVAPVLKNVGWADVGLYKQRLEPGGSDKRAIISKKRDLGSTPIDQNTDVTGATNATFKLKVFLPRTQEASAKPSDAPKVEKLAIQTGAYKFGDIVTEYSEGSSSILVKSGAYVNSGKLTFSISVDNGRGKNFQSTKFPFASALLKANSAKGFYLPSDYGPLELPATYKASVPLDQLEDKSLFIVNQPILIYDKSGYTCVMASVYSPIRQSFGLSSCK